MTALPLTISSTEDRQVVEAREWLREHMATSKKPQSAVAKAIGISSSAISTFLKGTYAGNASNVAALILNYRDLEESRVTAPRQPEYVETTFAKEIIATCRYAHTNRKLALIYGGAGLGKTITLRQYHAEHPGVVYLVARPSMRSQKALVEKLLIALGINKFGPLDREVDWLLERLSGSGRLIIIDEAQHLSRNALETLRYIYDEAGIGLVLAGNQYIFDRLHGRGEAEFAQFSSRVGIRRCLQRAIPIEDIKAIIETVTTIDGNCLEFLHQQAEASEGSIRYMVNLFMLASDMAYRRKQPLNLAALETARRFLMGLKEA